jgi:trypsin
VRIRRALLAALPVATALAVAPLAGPASAIVGGTAAPAGAYTFMASLQDDTGFAFCGASVISSGYALTAAHCVPDGNASGLSVVVGTLNNSNGSGTRIAVSAVSVHPDYANSTHDVAVLKLASAVPAGVTPIALAAEGDDALEVAGTTVTVAGWGDQTPLAGGGLITSSTLREVDLQVVADDSFECAADGATGICAAALLKDSCQGDSGGPLFGTAGGRRVQIGVVSYGLGCGVPTQAGVYSEVNNSKIRSFIRSVSGV